MRGRQAGRSRRKGEEGGGSKEWGGRERERILRVQQMKQGRGCEGKREERREGRNNRGDGGRDRGKRLGREKRRRFTGEVREGMRKREN